MHEDIVSEILKEQKITHVVSLPCDRTKNLCALLEKDFKYITVSREEDGIGICSGLSLAKVRSIIQMQSSGLGNSLNALLTLPSLYGLGLPILASWRGFYDEKIAAQIPFNSKIPELLSLYDIPCTIIREHDDLVLLNDVISDAFDNNRPHIALLSPKIWEGGESVISCDFDSRERSFDLIYHGEICRPLMQRSDAINIIAKSLDDQLVICNIGVPSKELYSARDRTENFYMLGSYTQTTPIGLGLACGTHKKVVVLDGDGSLLGTAVLPVVSAENPENLTIIVLDNGVYGSTGNQCSPAYLGVDLELYARACGIENTCKVHTPEALKIAFGDSSKGPRLIHVVIKTGNTNAKNIPLSPVEIRDRFIQNL